MAPLTAKRLAAAAVASVVLLGSGCGGAPNDVPNPGALKMGTGSECIANLTDNYHGPQQAAAKKVIAQMCKEGPASRRVGAAIPEIKRRLQRLP